MSLIALTRAVPDAIARCELTHLERVPIDLEAARRQHEAYQRVLAACGCAVVPIPSAHALADSVFVEDAAVVLDGVAIVTRPGASSRRAETAGVAAALAPFRSLVRISAPATLDGGDVLRLGRTLYVGVGSRTNDAGAAQLEAAAAPHGYEVVRVPAGPCLHLKSAVTSIGPDAILVNPAWADPARFAGCRAITVDPAEPFAANVLLVQGTILCAAQFPRTADRLRAAGLTVQPIDRSELAKAEGGLTCCSLLLEA